MQSSDRLSEDVIKIFHNAKGSVRKNISKWTEDANIELDNGHEPQHPKWINYDSPFDHAAGEYEPLPEERIHLNTAGVSNTPVHNNTTQSAFETPPASKSITLAEIKDEQESNT